VQRKVVSLRRVKVARKVVRKVGAGASLRVANLRRVLRRAKVGAGVSLRVRARKVAKKVRRVAKKVRRVAKKAEVARRAEAKKIKLKRLKKVKKGVQVWRSLVIIKK
jgi:hypothetical protein